MGNHNNENQRTGCYIRIPFTGSSTKYDSIRRAVARAASNTGLSQPTVALAMSYLFESIADDLCRGEVVAIPAFGAFFPSLVERPRREPKPYAAFCANRTLANEMKYTCNVERAREGKEHLQRHRKAHNPSNRPERAHSRVFTAQKAFRDQIRREDPFGEE